MIPDKRGKTREQIDAEWQEHVNQLRAKEVAGREGITVEQVRARWDAENEARKIRLPAAAARLLSQVTDLSEAMKKHGIDGVEPEYPLLSDTFEVESEMRGETIHYIEPTRRTSMEFYWTRGYVIYANSIKSWFHPADRSSTPVSDAEREQVVRRVVDWAHRVQGVTLEVRVA